MLSRTQVCYECVKQRTLAEVRSWRDVRALRTTEAEDRLAYSLTT